VKGIRNNTRNDKFIIFILCSEGDAKPPKMHEIEIAVPAAQAKLMRREEEKGTKRLNFFVF
jgi:hypothetical protein